MSIMSYEELKGLAGVCGAEDVHLTDWDDREIVVSQEVFANVLQAMANEPVLDFDETIGGYVVEYLIDESYLEMLWT